ncbi:galactose mutarotase-like enzyme [Larkinella arboricola]|uniref:Galactose mutarotase-like enzyme n=1 Tax=Larkinella arboricola TaxID=643671 RepID=A0A327WY80_LARAB|nr:aldose 1-epimerase family protein [Larkinella arboricola]RAJ98129.1 galactose mutarotase-like enzyme [Larkinella arboricola]
MTTLENDFLKVSVRPKGAELTSIYNKQTGTEHLWQADPAVWPWHAPNLFPVVGGTLDNQITVDGKTYPMERHGFARQSEFTVVEATPAKAVFSLQANEKTLAAYPYQFEFQIEYQIDNQVLTVIYRVINQESKPLYFSVGAHPAFAVPFSPDEKYEDYYLEFQKEEMLERHLLSPKGYFTGETEPVLTVEKQLPLTNDLFNRDALVFKNLDSRSVTIRSRHHDRAVTVSFPAFPYVGIWAKPGAKFVCIEPWLGYADHEGTPAPFEQKEAIQHVEPNGLFETGFTIGV